MAKKKTLRRRGDGLLESLYEATIKLTASTKLTNITFQQIADEANTSRSVLYRRWETPFDLLQDIYAYKSSALFEADFFDEMKDNGNLKADLLQLITLYQKTYKTIGAGIINNYFYLRMQDKDDSKEPAEHTTALAKYIAAIEKILSNAKKRGEKIKPVSKITLMLPYDLIRTENLIRPTNLNKKRLTMMVDEVLLPVFTI